MIIFREVHEPYAERGVWWHVELHDDHVMHRMYPHAVACVAAMPEPGRAMLTRLLTTGENAEPHRVALLDACRGRWPGIVDES